MLDHVVLAKYKEGRRRTRVGEAAARLDNVKSGMIFDETSSYLNKSSSRVYSVEMTGMWEIKDFRSDSTLRLG